MCAAVEKEPKQKADKQKEMFPLNIKIKQEKTTSYEDSSKSETVDKLSIDVNLTNIFSTTITSGTGTVTDRHGSDSADVKPSLEPLKSSNEILTELFRVFNAAPPEIIDDDSNDVAPVEQEKKKKKHKHKKKSKKHKGCTSDTELEGPVAAPLAPIVGEVRVKRKKIKKEKDREHKNKHKRKRPREETLLVTIKQEPLDVYEKPAKDLGHAKHKDKRDKEESRPKEEKPVEEAKLPIKGKIQIKSLKNSSIFKDLTKSSTVSKEHDHDRHHGDRAEMRKRKASDSDFSMSDDESRGQKRYYDFYQKKYNSFYASYEEENDRHRHERKRHKRSEEHDRRARSGTASSRSRSRSPEQFDKQKLLEIARKNAISMIKQGTLPGAQNLDGESKTKLISMVRTSGKSVEELTEYCKKLSNKDNFNDLSSVSSDESDHDADGGSKAFHHPFQLKEQAPIVMNIRNATRIQPKSAEEKKALLMQFPVSSGIQHRTTENEWVPVEPKKAQPPIKATAQGGGQMNKPKPKPILPPSATFVPQQAPLPTADYGGPSTSHQALPGPSVVASQNLSLPMRPLQPGVNPPLHPNGPSRPAPGPVYDPISPNYSPAHVVPMSHQVPGPSQPFGNMVPVDQPLVLPVDTSVPPPLMGPDAVHRQERNQRHPQHFSPAHHQQPGPPDNVFQPQPDGPQLDVAQIVSQRLNAMRKLQENPTDPQARQLLYNTQKDMSVWASSKVMPGQFLGTTGVNCLSQRELAEGYQPWARRDMMKHTAPVTGGMGMHLLQKMGWQPGEGLGKEKNGSLQPLLLDVKLDKRGLGEGENKNRNIPFQQPLFTRREERPGGRFPHNQPHQMKVSTEGKHPVSILGEYTTKRKWHVPRYELVHESGPGHAKNFIFKVLVNGLEYQPAISNNTKKEAKATAAKFCLQQLGVAIN
ncbi:protein Son [Anopheles bellator]|uniref:protein Son n=1 Tax=Anopheles bellator TaxID=139047 RepID=UPI0026486A88|nr:protein Son [Anopheles bellator]